MIDGQLTKIGQVTRKQVSQWRSGLKLTAIKAFESSHLASYCPPFNFPVFQSICTMWSAEELLFPFSILSIVGKFEAVGSH